MSSFEIFLVATPGLEAPLLEEVRGLGWSAELVPGGIVFPGDWTDVWRANLMVRGATRVLARIGTFMAFHLAQLDKRASKFDWGDVLRQDVPIKVEVTCRKSKIYHAGAAAQRIETALETNGYRIAQDAVVVLKVRIEDNRVTLSVDTSGESLHKRGYKRGVAKAPMRETMAAMMLRQCGYDGTEPVIDPMCGAGTFVIEAAEIAQGQWPGRARRFAFEHLATFDPDSWAAMRAASPKRATKLIFYGSDRDQGAIRMARENAEAAGVDANCNFECHPFNDLQRPEGPAGLVIINPPYGARIGKKDMLYGLYGALGGVLRERFAGWRVGLVTSHASLAQASGLPFQPKLVPISHGGLKVWLFQSGPLP